MPVDGPKKDKQILFRVSENELQVIRKTAESEGRSVGAWVRWTITNRLKELGVFPASTTKKAAKKK